MKHGLWNLTTWAARHVRTQIVCMVFGGVPRCWAVLLALYGAYESQCFERSVETSRKIKVGASEVDVLKLLGEPVTRAEKRGEVAAAFFGKVPRKWIYGTTINLRSFFVPDVPVPNPIPIRLRLFGTPDEEDLVIEWHDDHTVSKVMQPRAK